MAAYPDDLHYTKDHEWIRVSGDTGAIGITDFAQEQLGDVACPIATRRREVRRARHFRRSRIGEDFQRTLHPVSGEIIEINEALADAPELVNTSPYGDGWMVKIKLSDLGQVDSLLSASEYEDFVESQKEE